MTARVFFVATQPIIGLRKACGRILLRNINTAPKAFINSTVDPEELNKFTKTANDWWGSDKYSLLQTMNSLRVPLIRDGILSVSGNTTKRSSPLKGFSIIDIGCGGGILSEPLARLGASVTGLDPGQENVDVATKHALLDDQIKDKVNYVCDTVENLASTSTDRFDAVVCSEVIEHVANVETFVDSCVKLTKEGGSLFFTTINRTALSYVAAILGAEYVLGIVPQGTHDWNKFVEPKELSRMLQSLGCRIVSIEGMLYNPLTKKWSWCGNSSNMYALHAVK